jgi:SAM-dependent methyltransferase
MMKQGPQRFASPEVWSQRVSTRSAELRRARAIASAIPRESDGVLDVGCGDGSVLEQLEPMAPERQLCGIDLHAAALQALRGSMGPRITLGVADAAAIPFASRSFSAVICSEVLEHLPSGLFQAALVELARVARECVIISVPNGERLERRHLRCPVCSDCFHVYGHLRNFSRRDLRSLLPGFALQSLDAIGPRRNETTAALDRLWRRDRLVRALLICPACGWKGTGREAGIAPGNTLARLATRILTKAADRLGQPRWLLAVYRRDGR